MGEAPLENIMLRRNFAKAALAIASTAVTMPVAGATAAPRSGIVKTRSSYAMQETIDRIIKDLEAKKIKLFDVIDQTKLAREAGVDLHPSTLIVFGNPPLGTQFLTSRPEAGLDWPVRLLVFQDVSGHVWTAYTDFAWIAHRHRIKNRSSQFKMASEVIASIVASTRAS
jgi:uncharacterized protein (DUF302 family)